MPAIIDFETLPQLLAGLAEHYQGQNRPALSYKDKTTKAWTDITWDELMERVRSMAGYLHKKGVRPGDRVAVLSENRPEWAITDMATQMLGAVNVSLYTSLPASQVGYIIQDSGSKVFVVSTPIQLRKAQEIFADSPDLEQIVSITEGREDAGDHVQHWDEAIAEGARYWTEYKAELAKLGPDVRPGDLCALIYTSGTTGRPKGVMLTHENFCTNAKAALERIPVGPDDHHLSFLPLCHSFERMAGYIALLAAGTRVFYAESVDAVNKNLLEVNPTVMISVPRLFEKIYNLITKSVEEGSPVKRKLFRWSVDAGMKAARARDAGNGPGPILRAQQALAHKLVFSKLHEKLGGRLRFAVSGGAALPKDIGEFFQAAGITIIEGYGLTETAPVLAFNPFDKPRYGTVGQILGGVTVGIRRLSDGEIIGQVSGDDGPSDLTTDEGEIVVKGPNVMKGYWNDEEATREVIDEAGWYHTGDVGRFDRGYLTITDRIKHMIVSKGGKNIYPGPIEDQFKTVSWIDQIIVVGEGREYLTALVYPDVEALRKHVQDQGHAVGSDEELLRHEVAQQLFNREFRTYSRQASSEEKIRDFRLIAEPFTIEAGTMTPTMKLKRRAIEEQYADLIDEMYATVV